MAFFEQRLADCYTFGAKGGPMFSTTVNRSVSGQRFANRNWLYPLHRYDITDGVKSKSDFDAVRAFFYNVFGRADGFRFKDWADFDGVKMPATLISGVVYQLTKRYTTGSRTFDRPIYKPVQGKVIVYRTRAGVTSVIAPTIDYLTGQVTISGDAAGDAYTWTGQFDVPVAFVNDSLEAVILNKGRDGLLIQWPAIQIEEIRL